MKALLASSLLFILVTLAPAQTAPTFEQQRAASSQAVLVKYPAAKEANSHLNRCADKIWIEWQAAKDWRLTSPNLPMYLWDCAEIQRQLEVRLAQIRATNYVTPTAPVQPQTVNREPRTGTTTTISGSGGVYRTTGGAAGGATIINTAPGHYEVRQNGQTQRVIITTP